MAGKPRRGEVAGSDDTGADDRRCGIIAACRREFVDKLVVPSRLDFAKSAPLVVFEDPSIRRPPLIGRNALKHQATGGEDQFLGERDIAQFVRPVLFRHYESRALDPRQRAMRNALCAAAVYGTRLAASFRSRKLYSDHGNCLRR